MKIQFLQRQMEQTNRLRVEQRLDNIMKSLSTNSTQNCSADAASLDEEDLTHPSATYHQAMHPKAHDQIDSNKTDLMGNQTLLVDFNQTRMTGLTDDNDNTKDMEKIEEFASEEDWSGKIMSL